MKKNSVFVLIACFSVLCVVLFSGQQRSTRQPTRSRPTATKPPAKADPRSKPVRDETPELELPLVVLRPQDIHWPPKRDEDDVAPKTVTLLGDPRQPELYVTRTLIPKGKQIVPHIHGDSRTVVVISGTYYYGLGETFDATKLIAFPPGSFLTEPAGVPHYTWAKDEDVIIQTTAIGPTSTRVLPDKTKQ